MQEMGTQPLQVLLIVWGAATESEYDRSFRNAIKQKSHLFKDGSSFYKY